MVEESKVKSFEDFPLYRASIDEVKQIVKREGSFDIQALETFNVSWLVGFVKGVDNKGSDKYARGKYVTKHVRAVGESFLANLFDDATVDEIHRRFATKVTDEILDKGRGAYASLLISLVKK